MAIKVQVKNFQSIEDATVVIDGLTVLTGTNNAGKSALFRAVRGAFTNTPGYAFVRTGAPHCEVDLEFDDGQKLTWQKGKGVNKYIINGKPFPKVDRGIPAEVRSFGVEPIQVGDKELWPQIAPQLTGVVFLLNETGSVIAEAVADVERVKQLTSALKACDSDRRDVRADLKTRDETAATLATQRTSFAGLDIIVEQMAELDKRSEAGGRLEKALLNLERLANKLHAATADVEALRGVEEVAKLLPSDERANDAERLGKEIEVLRGLRDRFEAARAAVEGLRDLPAVAALVPSEERVVYVNKFRHGIGITVDLVTRYEKAQEELDRAQTAHEALANISLDDSLVERIQNFSKGVQMARLFQSRYARARSELGALDAEIATCEQQKAEVEADVARLLGSTEECPTCGQDLGHLHP
jgi:DNA repair exonuclease SbcCD ATPase subunit